MNQKAFTLIELLVVVALNQALLKPEAGLLFYQSRTRNNPHIKIPIKPTLIQIKDSVLNISYYEA